jgi:predicted DNA-binding transcriptional regulator AlpA
MKGHGAKLPRKRQQAIAALIECLTMKEAAKSVGVGEATIFRWMQERDFQKAFKEAKRRVVDQANARLQRASMEAVNTLRRIMNDPKKPPSSRVTAARIILDMSLKSVELEEVESRVEELERKLEAQK